MATRIDMHEGPSMRTRPVQAQPSHQVPMLAAAVQILNDAEQQLGILNIDSAISIEIIHASVAADIDENVGRPAPDMAGKQAIAYGLVVPWRAVATEYGETVGANPARVDLGEDDFQLGHQRFAQHHVFGPVVRLLLADKLAQGEMWRHREIHQLRGHLNLAGGWMVDRMSCR